MADGKKNQYGLTEKQEAFCQAYLKMPIMSQAFMAAYPRAKNWKRNSVDVAANRMLNNAKVARRLRMLQEEEDKKLAESCTLNKRKLLELGLSSLLEAKESGAAERQAFTNLLKLILTQQNYMPSAGAQVQVNIQNNTVVSEVEKFLNI